MTTAFHLHQKLATNAHRQLSTAVTLDERHDSSAIAAYQGAISLLLDYSRLFAQSSTSFQSLGTAEKPLVIAQRTKFISHLNAARNRFQTLTSHSPQAITAAPTKFVPTQPTVSGSTLPTPAPVQPPTGQNMPPESDPLRSVIEADVLETSPNVRWEDVYGLDGVKTMLQEMVVQPAQRPDLYKGLRSPGRGILLFGPPGTGKTLIAKAVATNVNATFFSVSASTLLSKFHGESERLVRTLFQMARERQPAFVFIDEADAILSSRSDNEHEASRRLKTEFMAQVDGATASAQADERVYIMAASNRPQDLDDAVRRRLDRRIYVPLPDIKERAHFLTKVMSRADGVQWNISEAGVYGLARKTQGFSGADLKALCREASLMPLRQLGNRVTHVRAEDVRPVSANDFAEALSVVRPSCNPQQIEQLEKWNEQFGSSGRSASRQPRSPKPSAFSSPDPGHTIQVDHGPMRRVTRSLTGSLRGASNGWNGSKSSYPKSSRTLQ